MAVPLLAVSGTAAMSDESVQLMLHDREQRYWYWLVVGAIMLISMLLLILRVLWLNRQLKRSKLYLERQYELILNSVADGIYGVDREGNSTFVNRAMEKITGWKAEELIGRNQHELLHHSHADGRPHLPEECPIYLTAQENRARFVTDDLFWRKDHSSFPVEYSSTPIRNERGSATGSVVVFRDISARQQVEDAARQHQMELAHVARLSTMGEMASGIAHEINQPLTAITTNAQAGVRMLESEAVDPEKVLDLLELIGRQAERAGEIIRQLRRFVRKEQLELTLVDLNDLVREVVVLLQPEAKSAAVDISLELDDAIGLVAVQQIQIEQVVLNLARNAIEAMATMDAGTRELTLRTSVGGSNAVIVSVEDSGPGLDQDVMQNLFDPFVTTKPDGMGLGLSISQGILEAHQGNIYADSKHGRGALFRFVLPVATKEQL